MISNGSLGYPGHLQEVFDTLRRYNSASVADVALMALWKQWPSKLEEIQQAPWLTLLLVKWAIREAPTLRVGPSIPIEVFDRLRQRLWSLGGTEHKQRPPANVFLMLRMLMSTQIEFQRGTGWGFLRWPALFSRTEDNHRLRRVFVEVLGMQPDTFMDMAFILYATAVQESFPIGRNHFDILRAEYGDSMDRMLLLLGRDLPSLRLALNNKGNSKVHGRHELYEFPYLKRFPLVRLRDGRIHCWHPLVLARGVEEAIHLRLSDLGAQYTEPFSKLFERYVVDLTSSSCGSLISEEDYWAVMGGDAAAVEAIVPLGECNVFIEAKMSLFGDDVLLADDDETIYRKTSNIRDGIRKAWTVSKALRENPDSFPVCTTAKTDYLIIVTSRELYLGTGERLRGLYPSGKLDCTNSGALDYLPLEHIFIAFIEDFERLTGCVNASEVSLQKVLEDAVLANRDPATSRFFLSDHLNKQTTCWHLPALISNARRDSASRLGTAMGGNINFEDAE
jgi:hypothetical protein